MSGTAIALRALDERTNGESREDVVRLGLWMFLATVTMLFAAFTSAYIVRRSGSDWRPVALPSLLWINTAGARAEQRRARSGAMVGRARSLAARERGVRRRAWRSASASSCGQWLAWQQLAAAGVYLPTSPHGSFFYMMTGAHALHVLAALAVLAVGGAGDLDGPGRGTRAARRGGCSMSVCRTFWHYLRRRLGATCFCASLLGVLSR